MDKPTKDDDILTHLAYGICQIRDEKKATCIHCRSVWYEIHYRDGVCHSCQQKQLPGRTEIARHARRRRLTRLSWLIVALLMLVYLLVR